MSIGSNKVDEFLVDQLRPFPLRDVSRLRDRDEGRAGDGLMEYVAGGEGKYAIFLAPDNQCAVRDRSDAWGKVLFP
jgi:hypothetical protein